MSSSAVVSSEGRGSRRASLTKRYIDRFKTVLKKGSIAKAASRSTDEDGGRGRRRSHAGIVATAGGDIRESSLPDRSVPGGGVVEEGSTIPITTAHQDTDPKLQAPHTSTTAAAADTAAADATTATADTATAAADAATATADTSTAAAAAAAAATATASAQPAGPKLGSLQTPSPDPAAITIPIDPDPTSSVRNTFTSTYHGTAAQQARARALFKKYGLELHPGASSPGNTPQPAIPSSSLLSSSSSPPPSDIPASIPGSSGGAVERVEKPVKVRVRRRCHHCNAIFPPMKICRHCEHRCCRDCPRYPLSKADRAQAAAIAAGAAGAAGVAGVAATAAASGSIGALATTSSSTGTKKRNSSAAEQANLDSGPKSPSSRSSSSSSSSSSSKSKSRPIAKKKKKRRDQDVSSAGDTSRSRKTASIGVHTRPPRGQLAPFPLPKRRSKSGDKYDSGLTATPQECHECKTTTTPQQVSICPNCRHVRCEECPTTENNPGSRSKDSRYAHDDDDIHDDTLHAAALPSASAASSSAQAARASIRDDSDRDRHHRPSHSSRAFGSVGPAAHVRQRVFRKPRMRVRWTCERCSSLLGDDRRVCKRCMHERCDACIREP